jgi:hypothetical protein
MSINITTLPSNIGGISVPGAVKGPLSVLYGSNYDKAIYRYPRDLGSNPARKHSIVFTVRESDPKNLVGVGQNLINDIKNVGAAEGLGFAKAILTGDLQGAGKQVTEAAEKLGPGVNDLSNALTKLNRKDGATIGLYIPDSVNVAYQTRYDDFNTASALGRPYFLAQGATSIINAVRGQGDKSMTNLVNAAANDPFVREYVYGNIGKMAGMDLARIGLNAGGYAMNPQLQVLFAEIGFRQFQFDFTFTPYSQEESDTIKKIIYLFKYHSAPQIDDNGIFEQGLYMKVPDAFKINFYYGNEENLNVHRIGECVLESMNVDYAGSGQWSTFNDGVPNQIKLTLQFKETVIVDKNKINAGY